jgi:hypothetical protein
LAIWLALPVFLLIQPAGWFDSGTSVCPSQLLLHRDCPGCGLTRAVQHAIHFDFSGAWHFNKLFVVILPLLIIVYLHVLGRLINRPVFSFLRKFY